MENLTAYKIKPAFFSSVLLLCVSVLLSCLMPSLNEFSSDCFKNVPTENLSKDADTNKAWPEEKEFSEDMMNIVCSDNRLIKFSVLAISLSDHKAGLWVPKASLDIPVPPPKNPTS